MATRELPEQLYAKFTHKGPIANLDHTLKYIWGTWLPKSGYEYVEKPDFELYSPRLTSQGPERILYLHIPVIKKS